MKIYNAQGQATHQQNLVVTSEMSIQTAQKLVSGVYVLEVNTGKQVLRTRFIVVND